MAQTAITYFSDEEIEKLVEFKEKYFKHLILRKSL